MAAVVVVGVAAADRPGNGLEGRASSLPKVIDAKLKGLN